MSNVSTRHNVNPFIAGKSQPLTNQRLAKIGYKKTAKIPNPLPSVCVSVPTIEGEVISEYLERLIPYIRVMLENAQDGIIRSLNDFSSGTLTSVGDEEISVSACIAFMEAESNGNRLTAEFVGAWFDSQVKENLTVVVAEKLGFAELNEDQMVTIGSKVKAYRDLFCGLTGKSVFYQPAQVNGLLRALEIASVDDEVGEKLKTKLEGMKPVEELLGL